MPITLEHARIQLRERLGEPHGEGSFENKELNTWLEEGARQVAIITECFATTSDVVALTGQYIFNAPPNAIRVNRMEWCDNNPVTANSVIYPLESCPMVKLNNFRQGGQSTSRGVPSVWSWWGYPGTTTFRLHVYPAAHTPGTLRIHYYRYPTSTGDVDSANLDVVEGWEHFIYDYAEYRARIKDRDIDIAKTLKEDFDGNVQGLRQQFRALTDNQNGSLEPDPFRYDPYDPYGW